MLLFGCQLWTDAPAADRTVLTSGPMLRRSVTGSGLTYEAIMEKPRLFGPYTATLH